MEGERMRLITDRKSAEMSVTLSSPSPPSHVPSVHMVKFALIIDVPLDAVWHSEVEKLGPDAVSVT